MASRQEEKARRKAERLEKERLALLAERRAKRLKVFGVAAGGALFVLVWVFLLVNAGGPGKPEQVEGAAEINAALKGVPQQGMTLGEPDAPVEIVEFGDPQCPACAAFSNETLPQLVDEYVKTGKAKLTFKTWAFLGEDSTAGGQAFLAAGEQNRAFNFIELLYRNQGQENTGYMTGEYLDGIARAAGLDIDRFDADRENHEQELLEIAEEASTAGLSSTPSFVITGPGGEQKLEGTQPLQAFDSAIAAAAG